VEAVEFAGAKIENKMWLCKLKYIFPQMGADFPTERRRWILMLSSETLLYFFSLFLIQNTFSRRWAQIIPQMGADLIFIQCGIPQFETVIFTGKAVCFPMVIVYGVLNFGCTKIISHA